MKFEEFLNESRFDFLSGIRKTIARAILKSKEISIVEDWDSDVLICKTESEPATIVSFLEKVLGAGWKSKKAGSDTFKLYKKHNDDFDEIVGVKFTKDKSGYSVRITTDEN